MKTKILIPLAGMVLFCACKGKGGYEVGSSGDADTVQRADIVTKEKLVKTAGMSFKVRNVAQTGQKIGALTSAFGGMVVHQQMGSVAERTDGIRVSADSVMRVTALTTTADMTVKVPSVRLQKFMDSVATMGLYVTNRSLDVSDETLDYLSAQMKLKSRSELISQQKQGKVVIKDPSKVLDLRDDMIDQQIGNRKIDDAVSNSTVNLSFYQSNTISREVVVNDDPSAYELPFFKRMLLACENGWALCKDVLVGLGNLWFFLLCGLGVWWLVRRRKRSGVVVH